MRAARACVFAAVVALGATAVTPARAAGSAADRDAARNLAGKGYELFEAGQHQRAIELFQQAEARFHAPPHLLYIARAQVKLGKFIEAEGSYQRVADEPLASDAPKPFREAQAEARAELANLRGRIPSLTIVIEGDAPAGTRVFVDGQPVDPGALGNPVRQNPGAHLVTAEPPGKPAIERTVVLEPRADATRVALPFPRSATGYIAGAAVSFSLGAIGIGVGVASAILARDAKDPTGLRIAEITGFALGGAAVVSGIVLLAVRPRATASALASPALRVGVGAGSVVVSGHF
ncbi:MAG: hypothetical protein QM820_63220 [Minicystis sp.]